MAEVPVNINGVIVDYYGRTIIGPIKIVGSMSRSDVGVGGGPIVPPNGGDKPPGEKPPGIWGGPIDPYPGHPLPEPPIPPKPTEPPNPPADKPPPDTGGWGYVADWNQWGYFPGEGAAQPKQS